MNMRTMAALVCAALCVGGATSQPAAAMDERVEDCILSDSEGNWYFDVNCQETEPTGAGGGRDGEEFDHELLYEFIEISEAGADLSSADGISPAKAFITGYGDGCIDGKQGTWGWNYAPKKVGESPDNTQGYKQGYEAGYAAGKSGAC